MYVIHFSGYYADIEAGCQVFRVCTVGSTYGFQSFLCPNGTLFNQSVFVCDWWMNVNCQESQQLFSNNNEQFGNLRLGPQLLKDIKKMLTYPMRNPYDKNSMKSNLIVMQDYKPPAGQLFPNGALIAGPERLPNKVYVPPKQVKQNIQNYINYADNTFAYTTPVPKLLPIAFSTVPSTTETSEIFQRPRGDARFVQNTQIRPTTSIISNGHARQLKSNILTDDVSSKNNNYYMQVQRPTQNYNLVNQQRQTNTGQTTQIAHLPNNQRGQLSAQRTQLPDNRKISQKNYDKQTETGRNIKQNNLNSSQNLPAFTYRPPLPSHLKNIPGEVPNNIKQNVVSTLPPVPSTIKTRLAAAARQLQPSKPNKARSKVTVKTWLVNPTKASKLISNPTAYTYNRPAISTTEKFIINPTTYTYNRPTISTTEKLTDKTTPSVFNPPTVETITENEDELDEIRSTPYYYSRPTLSSRQIITSSTTRQPQRFYLSPPHSTSSPVSFYSRFNIPSSTPTTYMNNIQYLINPTSIPQLNSRYYLPPDPIVSKNYLPPSTEQQLLYQFSQLKATPSVPSPVYVSTNYNQIKPTYTVSRQSELNTNKNNLTFADILTKEKIDVTVNDIVKDTNNILRTASPENFSQYREILKVSDYSEDSYLPATTDSGETLTSQSPITPSKSSRALELPLNYLIPPKETNPTQSTNKLSFLPYFKESLLPAPNTIERTVSLKITIPEKIAAYLFKNNNDSDFDRLEILNTGSSNYLVLSNNMVTSTSPSIIPLGKLVSNKDNNYSNSQALVFSLLADSLNAAKEYTNIAKQESLSTTLTPPPITTPQFPNVNNGDLSKITNKISQLTSSQYSSNNYNNANIAATAETMLTTQTNKYGGNMIYINHQQNQAQQIQPAPYKIPSPRQLQEDFYSPQPAINNNEITSNFLNGNDNKIYSGQLYQLSVPEVTNQIYNRPETVTLTQSNVIPQRNVQNIQQIPNQNNIPMDPKQSKTEVEIVQSESLPINSAKIELDTANEAESFKNDESLKNLLNSDSGISAHLQDKIIGTIPHPLEKNKLVTYEKEKSYYLFSKVDRDLPTQESKPNALTQLNNIKSQDTATTTSKSILPNSLAFQFLPSIGYQLEDEKEQQKLLNTFEIDEFGAPREVAKANLVQGSSESNSDLIGNFDYSVDQTTVKENSNQGNSISSLYDGPSSYLAPQSSIGDLIDKQVVENNNESSKLETFDNSEGYPKEKPSPEFTF